MWAVAHFQAVNFNEPHGCLLKPATNTEAHYRPPMGPPTDGRPLAMKATAERAGAAQVVSDAPVCTLRAPCVSSGGLLVGTTAAGPVGGGGGGRPRPCGRPLPPMI